MAHSATQDGAFATTRWTMVLEAGSSGDEAERALEDLCQAYWTPVYAFIRRSGKPPSEAKDLTQGFFLHLLTNRSFTGADPNLGKFRTYLLGAVKFYLGDEHRRLNAQKRGGEAVHFSIDEEDAERMVGPLLADDASPEVLFDRQWIRSVLDSVTAMLESEYVRRGKGGLFTELKQFLIGGRQEMTYADIARANGITESAVKMAVKRMRSRFGELLRNRIADTVGSDDAVDEEIRNLLGLFS